MPQDCVPSFQDSPQRLMPGITTTISVSSPDYPRRNFTNKTPEGFSIPQAFVFTQPV